MESLKNVVGVYGFVILGCESVSVKLIHNFFFFWESEIFLASKKTNKREWQKAVTSHFWAQKKGSSIYCNYPFGIWASTSLN